jgi:hypothetical protein
MMLPAKGCLSILRKGEADWARRFVLVRLASSGGSTVADVPQFQDLRSLSGLDLISGCRTRICTQENAKIDRDPYSDTQFVGSWQAGSIHH